MWVTVVGFWPSFKDGKWHFRDFGFLFIHSFGALICLSNVIH